MCKKLSTFFLLLSLCAMANATVTTWNGSVNSDWANGSNWSNGVPTASVDVIIPAGCATYPVLTAATSCGRIYFELYLMDAENTPTSARLGNQHLLTYNEAFYDLTIQANRYVRVASPLNATFTGDYYVKHQTLTQIAYEKNAAGKSANPFLEATYLAQEKKDVDEGAPYVNRSVKGTYYSFYSDYYRICDPYNTYSVDKTVDQWAAPINGLNTSIEANGNSTSFDVWVSNGAVYGGDNQDEAVTFRFPSSNTVYDYYATDGNRSLRNSDNINRTGKGTFVLKGTTYEETLTHPAGVKSSMFAAGNPAFAWLNMAQLLYLNSKTMAPFIFTHNEELGARGTENIYYCDYNEDGTRQDLYRIGTKVADAGEPNAGDVKDTYEERTKISSSSEEAYIRPAEGFRVMGGSVGFVCDEPDLIGVFTNSTTTNTKYSIASEVRNKYYSGTSKVTSNWTGSTSKDVTILKNESQDFAMSITTTGKSNVVRLNNFLNRGSVLATITKDGPDAKTGKLTIQDGSAIAAVFQGPTGNSWTASTDGDYWKYTFTNDKDASETVSYSSFGTKTTSFNGRDATTTITDRSKSKVTGSKEIVSRTLKIHGISSTSSLQLATTSQTVSYSILSTTCGFETYNVQNGSSDAYPTQDIVLNYEISNSGKVSISLPAGEKIFISSDAALAGAAPAFNVVLTDGNSKISDYLCESWFAYESVVAEKQNVTAPAGQDHIFEGGLGTYNTFVRENIGKVTLNGNEMIDYGKFSEHSTPYSIQIKPVLGSYNTVGILGLYPEDATTMVLGQIEATPADENKTFSYSDFTVANSASKKTDAPITVELTSVTTNNSYRTIANNGTIKVSGAKISKIAISTTGSSYKGSWTSDVEGTFTNNTRTWTANNGSTATSVTLTTSSAARVTSIVVTYEGYDYTMVIPAGQVAHYAGSTADPAHDYYFYSHGSSSDMIKPVNMLWGTVNKGTSGSYTGWHQTTAADNNACHESMIGRQMIQPKTSSPWFDGLVYGEQSNVSPIEGNYFYLDQLSTNYDDDDDEGEGSISNPESGVAHQIKFNYTNQLFYANIPNATSAPARVAASNGHAPMMITAASGEIVANTMVVRKENAKNAYSSKEDAPLFNANSRTFCLGTLAGTQLVAVNALSTLDTLPLYLSCSATLQFANTTSIADQVYLYDAVEETTVAIVDGADYALEILEGEQAGRYFLIGVYEAPENTTDIENVNTAGYDWKPVAYCPGEGSLAVSCTEELHYELYNVSGMLLGSADVQSYTFDGLQAGTYVVRATRGAEMQALKVIVY